MKLIQKIECPEIMAIYSSGRERRSEERKLMDESWGSCKGNAPRIKKLAPTNLVKGPKSELTEY